MADITSSIKVYEQDTGASVVANSPFEYKEIMVLTPATTDGADTFDITLANYGITTLYTIIGQRHSTRYSVIVDEDPTTVVASGVLTVTCGTAGVGTDLVRAYVIGGI